MNNDHNTVRAFIAVSLPEEVIKFLTDLQSQLQAAGIKAAWTKPENMHLTLKFLGNIDISMLDSVQACINSAADQTPAHTLSASGLGVFPSVKKTRVLWAGTRGQTNILEKLAKHLDAILFEKLTMTKERKRFSPHLTIARVKKTVPPKEMIKLLQDFKDFHSKDFTVSQVKLFQSTLTSSGAIHTQLFSGSLNN